MNRIMTGLLALSLALLNALVNPSATSAQTAPTWQTGATGMRTSSDPGGRTAGLSFIVGTSSGPSLSLQGGVKPGGWGKIVSSTTIELGRVKVAGSSHGLTAETADWAHDEMTFSGDLKLWVSRLSPAVLVQSQASTMDFLVGPVKGATWMGTGVVARADAPSNPKYVAFSSGGTIRVEQLSAADLTLPELDEGWILVWYGDSSHFVDTKAPLSYSEDKGYGFVSLPEMYGYRADAPVLFRFENRPASIRHSGEGGVEVRFAGASGNTTIMPLLGIDHPTTLETERWSGGLPEEVASKARFWAARMGAFPAGVTESYTYDAATDRATISESISYLQVAPGGVPFAALPPMLGTAILGSNSLGVSFSGPVVDTGYPTAFGPVMGIDGATGYSWTVPGLRRYTDARRIAGSGSVPPELEQELAAEVQKLVESGHTKPWIFTNSIPKDIYQGDIYFLNPSESLYHLAEVARVMPDTLLRSQLVEYVKSERSLYPPESVANLPDTGAVRGPFGLNGYGNWPSTRPDVFAKRVPLFSYYGLARYYELSDEPVPGELVSQASTTLDEALDEQDWASMSWFKGFGEKHMAVENANRQLTGLIGFVKLSRAAGDTQSEALGRAMLARAVVLRVAMAKYPGYLYQAGLVELPGSPSWQAEQTAGSWAGFTDNYDWTEPADDPRQVAVLDQFAAILFDHSGYLDPRGGGSDWLFYRASSHLSAFRDAVPEVQLLLADHAKQEALVQVEKHTANVPDWYAAFSEGVIGQEQNVNHPVDSYQVFMAKSMIQDESAQQLEKYLDIPWLATGDLFYMQKLAETIAAYGGDRWEGSNGSYPPPAGTPVPTIQPTAVPSPTPVATAQPPLTSSGPAISGVTANSEIVGVYDKYEATFSIGNSVATNPQLPYDPVPPPGLEGRTGISVEGLFLPPGEGDWNRALRQPGFLYQGYEQQQIQGREWIYPQGAPSWKVRFAPKVKGTWQFKVRAQDDSNYPDWVEGQPYSFTAGEPGSGSHGFVEASQADPRYFAYSDGSRFAGIGHNAGFSDDNMVGDAEQKLSQWADGGVDLVRTWMSQSDIAGSAWNEWAWFEGPWYGGYIPDPGLQNAPAGSGHDFTFNLSSASGRTCLIDGWMQNFIAVRPGTKYRFSAKVRVAGVQGPRDPGNPNYGFTVKMGGWPSSCPDGTAAYPTLTAHLRDSSWTELSGEFTSGPGQYFLDNLLPMLDNVTAGTADIARFSLRENLPGGELGPETLPKSNSDMHMDFNQLRSWDWDYVLDRAADKGVRLKLVVLEKNDRVWNRINPDGTLGTSDSANQNFYNSGHTKVRRLQEYFWRYLAARWGYSTGVHSWELMNEGDPFNGAHYDMANDFAWFIKQWDRNHLATTSFWHSFPATQFWGSVSYPDPGYADLHAYAGSGPVYGDPHDTAALHIDYSSYVRSFGLSKPTVRGETGIMSGSGEDPALAKDVRGVWLHNFLWAQLSSGGMYDLYWFWQNMATNGLYFQFKPFREFLDGIPLDNGRYGDTRAVASDGNVRVVGQSDPAGGRAHLWIQNRNHTWWNVVNGTFTGTLAGTVMVPGFTPNWSCNLEWWEFDSEGNLTRRQDSVVADSAGNLVLQLGSLGSSVTDAAVMIGEGGESVATPTATGGPTGTPTVGPSGTPTPGPSATGTPVPTIVAPTATGTPTSTVTVVPTATGTPSPSITPEPSSTATVSPSPTAKITGRARKGEGTVSPAAPKSWGAGESKRYNVTLTNTGDSTWNASGPEAVRLAVRFQDDGAGSSGAAAERRFGLPNDLPPGGSLRISIEVAAPSSQGSYSLVHQLVEGESSFGSPASESVRVRSR